MASSNEDEKPLCEQGAAARRKSAEHLSDRPSRSARGDRDAHHDKGLELAREAFRDSADTFKR